MRLAGFQVENFKSIGPSGCLIRIDRMVILIGRNNAGKSTILDAYEALASGGKALDLCHFHRQDPRVPVAITAYFDRVSTEEGARIGQGWRFEHPEFGACVALRFVWRAPGEPALRQSFDPDADDFVADGVQDVDATLLCRIPRPVRVRAADPTNTMQAALRAVLKEHAGPGTGAEAGRMLATLLGAREAVMSGAARTARDVELPRILLIDDPEACLHPSTARGACAALHAFALQQREWQVIATTHSPGFIDLTRDHATIIRIDSRPGTSRHAVSTDRLAFSEKERQRLRMIRACNPSMNELLFHDDIVLVEGASEQIALLHVARSMGRELHVVNCLGKANLPLFARLLNHFQLPYTVIHDADTRFAKGRRGYHRNALWATNEAIRLAVGSAGFGRIHTQFPHFEGEYFGESSNAGKVDRVLRALEDPDSSDFQRIVEAFAPMVGGDGSGQTTTRAAFNRKLDTYLTQSVSPGDPLWYQPDLPSVDSDSAD